MGKKRSSLFQDIRLIESRKQMPLYALLLPFFFVLRGLTQHFSFIPFDKACILVFYYLVAEAMLALLLLFFYKDVQKSIFTAFIFLAVYLLFGVLHDALKQIFGSAFITHYLFLLPLLSLLLLILLFLVRRKTISIKLIAYLNVLFVFLIVLDVVTIMYKWVRQKEEIVKTIACPQCEKPDIYLLLLDEYAGYSQLKKHFTYDNTPFLQQLEQSGFTVLHQSASNYSSTPFSISSLLNMEYLTLNDYSYTDKNLNYCYKKIATSKVVKVFQSLGYDFVNLSLFDIAGHASIINKTFLKSGIDLISSQTLGQRLKRDVYYNVLMNHFQNTNLYKQFIFNDLENNRLVYNKTIIAAKAIAAKPRFIYTHLIMPHFPYYYNEQGKLNPINQLAAKHMTDKSLYLSYLKYTNSRVLQLVDSIKLNASKPPVILLFGDHGFRYIGEKDSSVFSTLTAISLPRKNDQQYYSTISHVNQFPVLFNTLFKQQMPLLKDQSGE